jgi:hypothetical protein
MSLFEFLMVLVSIIVGLGVAEILTGVARLIRCRETIRNYWVHSVGVVAIFIALLQQWWEIWAFRAVSEWTFLGLVMMLMGPVGLFLIAHLLFPEPMPGADIKKYYYGAMRPVWWLAAATVVLATAFAPISFGWDLIAGVNATSFVLFTGFVVLGSSNRHRLHAILLPIFLILILVDVVLWNFALSLS